MNIDGMIEWWISLGKISINEPLMNVKKLMNEDQMNQDYQNK